MLLGLRNRNLAINGLYLKENNHMQVHLGMVTNRPFLLKDAETNYTSFAQMREIRAGKQE